MPKRKPEPVSRATHGRGVLIVIGGHEDKEGDRVILKEVARRVGRGRLVIATVGSHDPEGYFDTYREAFKELGLEKTVELYLGDREQAHDPKKLELLEGAKGVFFTGGDQLRITSQLGDTPLFERVLEVYKRGGVICGTSAGASALCTTMLVRGNGEESHRLGTLRMAPGLGLVKHMVIDQHFAERGRMGRLLGAVALNPVELGVGIDEDTAIVLNNSSFSVLGSGAVYVVDGSSVSYSNIAEGEDERTLSIFDVRLHLLAQGDVFDLAERRPRKATPRERKHLEELAGGEGEGDAA